ncbi:MAG TPA: MMPL family transporter [Solirubrobacteraceae bacterium]|nr:MMPL family transporter [Solirubrobacteraceae bacterium]
MSASRILSALAGGAARRPRLVVVVAVALGLGAAALALRLHPTAAASTLVSSSSRDYVQTQRFYATFGEEPIDVVVKGDLQQLVLSEDLERLLGLEGCLSGNVPANALASEGGAGGPCGQLARAHTVKVVLGPGTFVNEAASQIDEQLAAATAQAQAQARQSERVVRAAALARGLSAAQARSLASQAARLTTGRFAESLATVALQYGLTERPSITNRNFVSTLVFDSTKPAGTPKQRFAYLFPSRDAALVSVRLRAGLSESQRNHTIDLIRQAVAMRQWQPQHGERYLVTGEPAIVADLTHSITHSIELLLIAVLLVMAATLGLILSWPGRLLPLAVALLATALTFAALSLAGGSVAMAQVAVLPVLIGLAVDYAIQFQARVEERAANAAQEAPDVLVAGAAGAGAATIATAAAASASAMLVLLLSPVPMVRGFAVLLAAGLAIAFLCALTAGAAGLALVHGAPRRRAAGARAPFRPWGAWVQARLLPAWRGARELVLDNPLAAALRRAALSGAVRRPRTVLAVGFALAALGIGLDTQTHVETDITKLVPQGLSSLQALDELERITGVGGEIDVMISGPRLATPATIEWMSSYQSAVLRHFGYSATRGCGQARLCPAFSLPDLFAGQLPGVSPAGASSGHKLSAEQVDGLLAAIPPYFSQDVISGDGHTATLAFGIRLMSLQQQQQLIDGMRARLHPPRGISAQLVGLPVLAAASGAQVASVPRRLLTLAAGLLAVALVLLLLFRGDRRRALVPVVPVALASGWSALVLFAVRVPLNPMSVTLGALVIAISTEFSVLLSERHRQERLAGHDTLSALRRAYERTGAAVLASGITAIAGFGVLVLSDIRMLRDFGLVTLIDLTVSLAGVMIALPAALLCFAGPDRDLRERALARSGDGGRAPAHGRNGERESAGVGAVASALAARVPFARVPFLRGRLGGLRR